MVARSRSSRIVSIIVLSLTITLGIIDILTFNRHLGSSQIVLIFLISITIALSVFMFIKRNENLVTNISVFGLMCSLFVLQEGLYSFDHDDIIDMSYALLECSIGVLGIYLNLLLYIGNRYNQMRLYALTSFTILILILPILYDVAFDYTYLWDSMVKHLPNTIDIIILSLYMIILSHPDVRYHSSKIRLGYNVNVLDDTLFVDKDAYMDRKEFLSLIDGTIGWESSDHPEISGVKTAMFNTNGHKAKLVMRRHDDGTIYGTFIANDDGTHIQELTFPVRQLTYNGDSTDCDMFTIYGDTGYFIRMMVKDEKPVPKNRLTRFYRWMTGY